MKKWGIFLLILFAQVQCISADKSEALLYNLNYQYRSTLKDKDVQFQLNRMSKVLETMVFLPSAPKQPSELDTFNKTNYYKESLDTINQVAQAIGLITTNVDTNNILIHSPIYKKSSADNVIFVIQLDSFITKQKLNTQLKQGLENNILYGYQSLYPKGFLTSLLWAILDFNKTEAAQWKYPQILITQDKKSLANIKEKLQQELGSKGLLIYSGAEYPGVQSMSGELDWTLTLPQDKDWLTDISTLENTNGKVVEVKYNILEDTKKVEKVTILQLSGSLESYIKNPYIEIAENIQKLGSFFVEIIPDLANSSTNSKNNLVFSTMQYLKNNARKSWNLKTSNGQNISLFNVEITGIKTNRDKQIQIFFKSKVSGELPTQFPSILQDFVERNILKRDTGTTNSNFSLNSYYPSYNIDKQLITQPYSKILKKAYNNAYNERVFLYHSQNYYFPLDITPNNLIIGTFFQSADYYRNVHFVPVSKIYLDYKYIMQFLSIEVKK